VLRAQFQPRTIADLLVGWRDELTGGRDFDPDEAPYAPTIARIDAAARTTLSGLTGEEGEPWRDLDTSRPLELHTAYTRLSAMALAWATYGSSFEGDPTLLAETTRVLRWLSEHRYNTQTPFIQSTWWYWTLGIPLELNTVVVLLGDSLPHDDVAAAMDTVARFTPEVTLTGANRLWSALVVAVRAVILRDSAALQRATDDMVDALVLVTSGDGFYADGSFIQHTTIPYTGGYGLSFLSTLGSYLSLVNNSRWEPSEESVAVVAQIVTAGVDPVVVSGVMMDAVRGREVSRFYNQANVAGATAIMAVLQLADATAGDTAGELQAIARRWLRDDQTGYLWQSRSISSMERAQKALASPGGAADATTGTFAFAAMDRAVHRGRDYAFSVSMSSSRIATFEMISGQNLRGWFTGSGATAIYAADIEQYSDNYWPTVNAYRIPGTTVDTAARAPGEGSGYLSGSPYAGSLASASGQFGVAGMQLQSFASPVTANKAWFFFDNEIVALGSGITATELTGDGWDGEQAHVETVIDNRKADPTVASDLERLETGTGWAHIADRGDGIGYVFDASQDLEAESYTGRGSWHDINSARGSEVVVERDFDALWIDHGTSPRNETYSYTVLPGSSAEATVRYSDSPDVSVLANTTNVSAVRESTLGVVSAAFWSPTASTVKEGGEALLSVRGPALVTLEQSARELALTVADPTQEQTSIRVEIMRSAIAVDALSPGVAVVQLAPTIILEVNTTGSAGASFTARFQLGVPDRPFE
jgi:hyaluronate lyase